MAKRLKNDVRYELVLLVLFQVTRPSRYCTSKKRDHFFFVSPGIADNSIVIVDDQ